MLSILFVIVFLTRPIILLFRLTIDIGDISRYFGFINSPLYHKRTPSWITGLFYGFIMFIGFLSFKSSFSLIFRLVMCDSLS